MEFSKEINQTKPFRSEAIKAMLNVIYTANKFQTKSVSLLKPYKINDQHYNILRILKGKKGKSASPGEIKSVLVDSRGDLTRLIDKLVKMELVDRCSNNKDRRGVDLLITAKGLALLTTIEKEFDANQVYDFAINEAEAKQLNILLDKIRTNQ